MTRILVIDNYDSFVYNIVQYLAQLGAKVDVKRNDEVTVAEVTGAKVTAAEAPTAETNFVAEVDQATVANDTFEAEAMVETHFVAAAAALDRADWKIDGVTKAIPRGG